MIVATQPSEAASLPEPELLPRVGLPRRVPRRVEVAQAVRSLLDAAFPGAVPTQRQATAFSMRLAWELSGLLGRGRRVLLGSPKSEETRELLRRWGLEYLPGEFQGDFTVVDADAERVVPLLTCESEAYSGHGVGFCSGLDLFAQRRAQGFLWDFCKLLHARAPTLLHVARAPAARLELLTSSLAACASTYADVWKESAVLAVLLPTAARDREQVRIGYGLLGMPLRFERLQESLVDWPTGVDYVNQARRLWMGGDRLESAELETLGARVLERNDYLWARYAVPLLSRCPGQWVALSAEGHYHLAVSREEAQAAADRLFGEENALIARLDESRGLPRLGGCSPRA